MLSYENIIEYKSILYKLLIDVYKINFKLSIEECISICNEKIENMVEYVKNDKAIIIGACNDEDLVGFIWLFKNINQGEQRLHVIQIVVKEEYRNKGIGKQLMMEAEKQAKNNDITTLELNVIEENRAAVSLYESLGYLTEKRLMTKKL